LNINKGEKHMTIELTYLTWITTFTAFIWIPYVLNMIVIRGLLDAVGYPENPKPLSPWATRMKAAHSNAVDNLVVFAALVIIASVAGISNEMTVTACMIYFWARVIHLVSYTARIPWARTISFVAAFVAQIILASQILF
jgi:uncharacterized MAPEG superfamily protein